MKVPMSKPYFVYILECADQTLYTGITTDLKRRLKKHEAGTGAKYTRGRGPYQVRYVEAVADRSIALRVEKRIKELTRAEKWQLIQEAGGKYVSSEEL